MRNIYLNKEAFKEKYGVYSENLIALAKSYPRDLANIGDTAYSRGYYNEVYEAKIDRIGALSNYFRFKLRNDYNDKRKSFTSVMYDYHYYTDDSDI